MKKTLLTLLAFGLLTSGVMADDISGVWKTVDDETGQAKSYVNIWVHNGTAYGKITKLLNRKPNEDPDPVCTECKGQNNGKKIVGLTIIWGLKEDGGEWTGGHIMDPKNGKTYKCKIKREGNTLKVRGFIGFSLLGRTQTWHKL
ncbi:MAG TPA: DUF2147 domain-containing protein [Turneriella sp.]|nr:DUF2147 domain-containing protein [Turneriella sp.]